MSGAVTWLPGSRDGGPVHGRRVVHDDGPAGAGRIAEIWARNGTRVTVAPCRCTPGSGPISGGPPPAPAIEDGDRG